MFQHIHNFPMYILRYIHTYLYTLIDSTYLPHILFSFYMLGYVILACCIPIHWALSQHIINVVWWLLLLNVELQPAAEKSMCIYLFTRKYILYTYIHRICVCGLKRLCKTMIIILIYENFLFCAKSSVAMKKYWITI